MRFADGDRWRTWLLTDQRTSADRPDVLVYQTGILKAPVRISGAPIADLSAATTGTDSDWVVKVIDVYPPDYPDYNAPPAAPAAGGRGPQGPANAVKMGGYQELIRGEPFRGKFRKRFEKPVAFEPGKPDRITFRLPDVAHTWREGHRIMVQIQSSWFPLVDRNPQKFMEIPKALSTDFMKATERVYYGGTDGSKIEIRVEEPISRP